MRLLLVDRSAVVRARLCRLLAEMPAVTLVAGAQTAEEALELARTLQPDAVVVDVALDGGGVSLLRELKALDPAPYVVVLTNDPSPTYCGRCLGAADLCLDKTHEMESLVEALREQSRLAAKRGDAEASAA